MFDAIESLLQEGYQARRAHRSEDAKAAFAQAEALSRESQDQAHLAQSLAGLGRIERDQQDICTSIQHYQQAATIYRALDNPLRLAHTIRHIGDILRESGQPDAALPCYEEAMRIYRAHPETNTLDLANALRGYALLQTDMGNISEAIELWQEAGALYKQAWQEPNSPWNESDMTPGILESQNQIAALTNR